CDLTTSLPVYPTQLIVLAIGVVVALLRAVTLVAGEDQRRTLRDQQRGQHVALLARAQLEDLIVVGRSFHATVPADVVIVPVGAIVRIGLFVLVVVAHEIREREAVVRGDQVDARPRPAPAAVEEIARAGDARRELTHDARVAAPEAPHRVSV